jgi:hypothetical protein
MLTPTPIPALAPDDRPLSVVAAVSAVLDVLVLVLVVTALPALFVTVGDVPVDAPVLSDLVESDLVDIGRPFELVAADCPVDPDVDAEESVDAVDTVDRARLDTTADGVGGLTSGVRGSVAKNCKSSDCQRIWKAAAVAKPVTVTVGVAQKTKLLVLEVEPTYEQA